VFTTHEPGLLPQHEHTMLSIAIRRSFIPGPSGLEGLLVVSPYLPIAGVVGLVG
jgi:hypothetical protein